MNKIEKIREMLKNAEEARTEMLNQETEYFGYSHCDNNGNIDMIEADYKHQLCRIWDKGLDMGLTEAELDAFTEFAEAGI